MESNFDGNTVTNAVSINDSTSKWNVLYCSHLWSNTPLRKAIINASSTDSNGPKYCYTCRGKIRKYQVKNLGQHFTPDNHSTPNTIKEIKDEKISVISSSDNSLDRRRPYSQSPRHVSESSIEINHSIPTISSQIDNSFRQKYTSYDIRPKERNARRLRKSLKGIGCIVNFALMDSPVKKRTQIQACSISVMIIAIVVITFVLVNFTTPIFTHEPIKPSTIVVPTLVLNETSSTINDSVDRASPLVNDDRSIIYITTTESVTVSVVAIENTSLISNTLLKILKNIKTYPRDSRKNPANLKPREIINRDLMSQKFCSCQTNEVCMLDENNGTSICRKSVDINDPTGCGGLCALETEACQLVDRVRGVRVCRLLSTVTCSTEEWRCHNGYCVSEESRCDGSIQCSDKSDEMRCECDLRNKFRCGNFISCFPNNKLCDGVVDCWDGFDEVNCTTECSEQQFTCSDGQCILPSRFCDGYADCTDGSDEPLGCGGGCAAHEIRCNNGRCVPQDSRCDSRDNCGDLTDELHCS